MKRRETPDEENQRLESRVRENRTHGSEGGEAGAFPTPIGGGAAGGREIEMGHQQVPVLGLARSAMATATAAAD
jgi:hypothetical protein